MHFKKNLLIFFVCIFSCGVLCGCHKTPQEVIDRTKDYGKNEQIAKNVDITYYEPLELKNANISDVNIDTGNIELPDKIDFSAIEDVSLLHMSYEKDFLSDKDQYLQLFGVNKNTFSESSDGMLGVCETYDSKTEKKGFNISDNGFISYYSGVTYDYIVGENADDEDAQFQTIINNEYDIDTNDISETNITLNDGSINLLKMCRKAEKWLTKKMPAGQLEYHISDALTKTLLYPQDKKESPVLTLCAELEYKGIRLNNHVSQISDNSEKKLVGCDINISYDTQNTITFFSNGKGTIKLNSAESLEKIVDFKSAVNLVNKKLADFNKLKIEKIIPLYVIYSTYDIDTNDYISAPGKSIDARPVYAFLFNKKDENEDLGISKEYEHFVIVDMETGELTTDFENLG